MTITYTLSLTVTRAVGDGSEPLETLKDIALEMASAGEKRELEREVLLMLRRLDGDCDIEVMSHEITIEDTDTPEDQ